MTCGSEEPNAIVQIGKDPALTDPNVIATEIELYEGLEAFSQNCWPSVNFDIGGINNFLSPLLPAGFYYKTFMWPASFWEKYEFFIRHSAGLGKSPTKPDQDLYDHQYVHCDVLVIGGGISGIMAAKTSAQNNLKTLLVEEKPHLGGSTIYQKSDFFKIKNQKSSEWLKNEINELPYGEIFWRSLGSKTIVYDLIYNPAPTHLLKFSANKGCMTIDGLQMLVAQGLKSLSFWTNGLEVPFHIMNDALKNYL